MFLLVSLCSGLSAQSRTNAPMATVTLLSEMNEATGWWKDSLGQWQSGKNKVDETMPAHENNNFTFIKLYNVSYNDKEYVMLEVGFNQCSSGSSQFIGGNYFQGNGRSSIIEFIQLYIIDVDKFKIRLIENIASDNIITFVQYEYESSKLERNVTEEVAQSLLRSYYSKGIFHIFTYYYKEDNVIRFYIQHYLDSIGPHYDQKALEGYYYEYSYQQFVDLFGR
jgi:hypothetical protein